MKREGGRKRENNTEKGIKVRKGEWERKNGAEKGEEKEIGWGTSA